MEWKLRYKSTNFGYWFVYNRIEYEALTQVHIDYGWGWGWCTNTTLKETSSGEFITDVAMIKVAEDFLMEKIKEKAIQNSEWDTP